jgi:hypothetical protein
MKQDTQVLQPISRLEYFHYLDDFEVLSNSIIVRKRQTPMGSDTFVEKFRSYLEQRSHLKFVAVNEARDWASFGHDLCVLSNHNHVYCRQAKNYGIWKHILVQGAGPQYFAQDWSFTNLYLYSSKKIVVTGQFHASKQTFKFESSNWEATPLRPQRQQVSLARGSTFPVPAESY